MCSAVGKGREPSTDAIAHINLLETFNAQSSGRGTAEYRCSSAHWNPGDLKYPVVGKRRGPSTDANEKRVVGLFTLLAFDGFLSFPSLFQFLFISSPFPFSSCCLYGWMVVPNWIYFFGSPLGAHGHSPEALAQCRVGTYCAWWYWIG